MRGPCQLSTGEQFLRGPTTGLAEKVETRTLRAQRKLILGFPKDAESQRNARKFSWWFSGNETWNAYESSMWLPLRLKESAPNTGSFHQHPGSAIPFPTWVWVKMKPPGYGQQILVLGSIYQGKPFGHRLFDPLPSYRTDPQPRAQAVTSIRSRHAMCRAGALEGLQSGGF